MSKIFNDKHNDDANIDDENNDGNVINIVLKRSRVPENGKLSLHI